MTTHKTLKEYKPIKKISPQAPKCLGTQFRHQNRGTQSGRIKVR